MQNRDELDALIVTLLRAHPTSHWIDVFNKFDVPNDAVQNTEQVMQDPQVAALDQLAEDRPGRRAIPSLYRACPSGWR